MADFVTQISSLDGKTTSNTESLTDFDSTIPQILTFYNDFTLLEKPTKIFKRILSSDSGIFDFGKFDEAYFDKRPAAENILILPPNGIVVEDLRTYAFIDVDNSTGSLTTGRWDANNGDVLISTDVYYDSQSPPKSKATFDFSQVDTNLDFTVDQLFVSIDGGNTWIDISSNLTYEGSFNQLRYKIVANADGRYLECKDFSTKELKVYTILIE